MPNQYKSFYRADIINKIREVALNEMAIPNVRDDMDDAAMNRVAVTTSYYNYGLSDLADALIRAFEADDDE